MNKTPLLEFVYNRRKTATATKEAAVELRATYERRQKYMSTGIRLLPKHWHRGTVVNRVDAIQINQTLDKLMIDVRKVILEMMEEGIIDIFDIPERLRRLRTGDISFLDFCKQRMDVRKYGKATDSKQRYDRFFNLFEGWGRIKVFEDITDDNIIAFDLYLANKGMKNYSKWQNYHRFLNSFIIDAVDAGLLRRNPYRWVRIEKEKTSHGLSKCLTPEEFQSIREVKPQSESMERVRDLFVFQTYTCLAYTDLVAFDYMNIQEVKDKKVYIGKRGKTKESFTIPLLDPALDILSKYKNKLPIISNVKYNEYLKVLAQAAKIDKPLSSHWARHTGATLLLNNGVSMQIVSRICGHSSTKITEQVYAKLYDESVVDAVSIIENKL
jgi:site-specific recombinase XerD